MSTVIDRVSELVREKGMTINSLAREVGIGSSNLSRKMKGMTPFTNKDYLKICDTLNVSREWLENGVGDKYIGNKSSEEAYAEEFAHVDNITAATERIKALERENKLLREQNAFLQQLLLQK